MVKTTCLLLLKRLIFSSSKHANNINITICGLDCITIVVVFHCICALQERARLFVPVVHRIPALGGDHYLFSTRRAFSTCTVFCFLHLLDGPSSRNASQFLGA